MEISNSKRCVGLVFYNPTWNSSIDGIMLIG